jgi:hypothetical protein
MKQDFFEGEHSSTIDWGKIKEYRTSGEEAGLMMALIESHKLLAELLERNGYVIGDFKDSLILARERFTNFSDLLVAYKLRERLVSSRDPVDKLELSKAISAYQKAIYDLSSLTDHQKPGLWGRGKAWLDINLLNNRLNRSRLAFYFSLSILFLFLLDNFDYGVRLVELVTNFIGEIGFWILVIGVGIILIVLIFASLVNFFEDRTR